MLIATETIWAARWQFKSHSPEGTAVENAQLLSPDKSGPSAVRIYTGVPGKLSLAARIDRYAQKDFLDDYIELVPIPGPAAIFVTVAGRTDDLKTGVFTAWHFDGHEVQSVWSSDILLDSDYQATANGFDLSYCADDNLDDPGRATRDSASVSSGRMGTGSRRSWRRWPRRVRSTNYDVSACRIN